jgi:cytochrome P450
VPAGDPKPPGPREWPFLGNSFMVHRDPLATLTRWARDYGDIVYYRFFGLPVYFLVHPRDIEQVLLTRSQSLSKGLVSRSAPELFGKGLLTSDGGFWQRQRRLSNPAFHREKIARYSEITTEETARLIASWQTGETRNIHQDMMNVTLRIVLRSFFGTGLDGAATRLIERALGDIMQSSSGIHSVAALFLHLPTPAPRRYLNAVHELDGVVVQLIAQGKERLKRGSAEDNIPKDLLTMLLLAKDENGSGMRDAQLRDEVITLLLAGHETTALNLSWTWYLLAQYPEVEERLHAELDTVIGGRRPTMADLPRLPYVEQVLREALRLYPPAWRIVRTTSEPFAVSDYILPAGANIVISQWITHRDPRWFPEPDRFNPDRWVDGSTAKLPHFAYFPFGGGPRVCIGAGFALMEASLLLASIAQRFRLRLVSGLWTVLEIGAGGSGSRLHNFLAQFTVSWIEGQASRQSHGTDGSTR